MFPNFQFIRRHQTQLIWSRQWEWGWSATVAGLRGREPGRGGATAAGSNVTENTGLCVALSCETDDSQRGRRLSSRCQAVPSEHTADVMRAVLIYYMCTYVNLLYLILVTIFNCAINRIANPNHLYSLHHVTICIHNDIITSIITY
jgi:hypothetical protein